MTERVQVLEAGDGPSLDLVDGPGRAWAVVWPGSGAKLRSLVRIALEKGSTTRRLNHPGEAVYYVTAGGGTVARPDSDESVELREGSMFHCGPEVTYRVEAGEDGLELVGGPSPPDPAIFPASDTELGGPITEVQGAAPDGVNPGLRGFHRDEPDKLLPMVARDARLVVWPGTGAETANMNFVDMQPGEENVPHSHSVSEDSIFVLSGEGTIRDLDNEFELSFRAGQVLHVPVGLRHQVLADKGVAIVSVGGPCPADIPMLRVAGVLD